MGYLRRALPFALYDWVVSPPSIASRPRLRIAKRFSSSRFSDVILSERILVISSWSDQSSSTDMASRLFFFMTHYRFSCSLSKLKLTSGACIRPAQDSFHAALRHDSKHARQAIPTCI